MDEDRCEPNASVGLGSFERFADAWIACLRQVALNGVIVRDNDVKLRESLNVSLSARSCDVESLAALGASEARVSLMVQKYSSLSVLPEYDLSYGALFRDHCGVDQVAWITERIVANRDTKSATIGFHLPGSSQLSCISLVDCKLRGDLLHLSAVFRSQNIYGSQPGNAVALRKLQDEIAEKLDVRAGYLTLHIMSAHIYETDWNIVDEIISKKGAGGPVS